MLNVPLPLMFSNTSFRSSATGFSTTRFPFSHKRAPQSTRAASSSPPTAAGLRCTKNIHCGACNLKKDRLSIMRWCSTLRHQKKAGQNGPISSATASTGFLASSLSSAISYSFDSFESALSLSANSSLVSGNYPGSTHVYPSSRVSGASGMDSTCKGTASSKFLPIPVAPN